MIFKAALQASIEETPRYFSQSKTFISHMLNLFFLHSSRFVFNYYIKDVEPSKLFVGLIKCYVTRRISIFCIYEDNDEELELLFRMSHLAT